MTQARKFAFDTEFAPDGAVLREAPKRLTPEEIEAKCAQAYEKGKQDAVAQAERDAAAALAALADGASAILSHLDAESRAMRAEAARIAIIAARKIADAALDAFGAERAAVAIEAAMDALRHQPRLVVKLSPAAVDVLKPRIDAMCDKHAYAGVVLVRAEPGFAAGEISVDWSDGVVTLDPADAASRINALLESALAAEQHQT
jgi:flagellar assembly protein FliH